MSKRKHLAVVPTKTALRKLHLFMFATFTCVGLACWQGLVWSRNRVRWNLVALFAFVCVICLLGAVLSIAFPLANQLKDRPSQHPAWTERLNTVLRTDHGDYVARFSIGDKITYLCVTAGLALIVGFLFYHSARVTLLLLIAGLLTVNCIGAYRVCFTTVRFGSQEISMRIVPFVHFSEPYGDITAIRAKTGSLRLRFADGRSMSLWSGLGDSNEIVSILMGKTDVLPST